MSPPSRPVGSASDSTGSQPPVLLPPPPAPHYNSPARESPAQRSNSPEDVRQKNPTPPRAVLSEHQPHWQPRSGPPAGTPSPVPEDSETLWASEKVSGSESAATWAHSSRVPDHPDTASPGFPPIVPPAPGPSHLEPPHPIPPQKTAKKPASPATNPSARLDIPPSSSFSMTCLTPLRHPESGKNRAEKPAEYRIDSPSPGWKALPPLQKNPKPTAGNPILESR